MKIVMTLLVKNEVDIIDANMRFHMAAGVSHIIATDNGSSDGTREILVEYARQGILTLIDEPASDYSQWRWVTRMAMLARDQHAATWVLNNDADEFWWHDGRDLRPVLERSETHIVDCERYNLFSARIPDSIGDWKDRLVFRSNVRVPMKPPADRLAGPLDLPYVLYRLPTKALVRADGLVSIHQGNHDAVFSCPVSRQTSAIKIFHVPFRSVAQVENKVRQGGEAYARNQELSPTAGWHWRRWYQMLNRTGIDAVLRDILPSEEAVAQGMRQGTIIRDLTLRDALGSQFEGTISAN